MKAQTRYCFLTSDLIVYTKEKAFSSSGKKYIFKVSKQQMLDENAHLLNCREVLDWSRLLLGEIWLHSS